MGVVCEKKSMEWSSGMDENGWRERILEVGNIH